MSGSLLSLFIYTSIILALALIGIGLFLYSVLKRKMQVQRALNMVLFLVRLPLAEAKEELNVIERIREKISVMEQFYASLAGLKASGILREKPWLAVEMTVPAKDVELSFYLAVPRRIADTVEKLAHAYYPDASVEKTPDYNIFTPEGHVLVSEGIFTETEVLPLKNYMMLETDPLKTITSVFTKLDEEKEGAAIQIIFRPAASKWRKSLIANAKRFYKGEGRAPSHGDILREVVTGPKQTKKPDEGAIERSPVDEARARALEDKASKPLFESNIRLVASASTPERANVILESLEQAFQQFANPGLNSIAFKRVKPRKVSDEVFKYSFRLFDEKKLMVFSATELTSLYHFPNTPLDVPGITSVKAKDSAPPTDIPKEGLLVGYNLFRGVETPIRFLREDRRRHFYIIGQTGTGKSNFLKGLIAQDIRNGEGVCIIDPHGELTESALGFVPDNRIDDVIYFDPGDTARPMGLNMLEYDERFPEHKTLLINELLAIFEKLFNMSIAGGPMFEQYFRNAALLVMDDPSSGNTLLEIGRVLADKPFRDAKLARTPNTLLRQFWTQIAEKAGGEASLQNMVPYITSKFDVFLSNDIMRPIIAQQKSSFNFRDAMDQKKILLINLSKGRLGEINSALLGLILVGKLLLSALSRTNTPEESRADFYLYIDEFQNVTTKSIATILSEARKYRLDMIMTHQFIGQLEEEIKKAVFGNVGSLMAFRIGSEDGEFLEHQFAPDFTARDLLSLDNFRAYVKLLVNGKTSRPFSMRTYPAEKPDTSRREKIKEISRMKYGRPRDEVEAEIRARREMGNSQPAAAVAPSLGESAGQSPKGESPMPPLSRAPTSPASRPVDSSTNSV